MSLRRDVRPNAAGGRPVSEPTCRFSTSPLAIGGETPSSGSSSVRGLVVVTGRQTKVISCSELLRFPIHCE
jgi:hypothetical protein